MRRFVSPVSAKVGLLLALLPLTFTGEAMLLGKLYGPADLYYLHDPWKRVAEEPVRNPILSDLAFANLPWRSAVREAVTNGRLPLWNRFVLAGNPLLAAAQAGVFHPATWFAIFLPVALSWTFSSTFTIFLSLLAAYLFFRDFGLGNRAALVGGVGWGFSTYLLFWNGWSVGGATAVFPLLLLGLRRLAREPGGRSVGLTTAALFLSFTAGHPESFFHSIAAGGIYFLWEVIGRTRRRVARSVGAALLSGVLAFLFVAPQLLPLLQALPHSAEYRARRKAIAEGKASQSVAPQEAGRRLLPALLPFAYGIYGKSPVQAWRQDGSGMPLAYYGALLFPMALVAFGRARAVPRGRSLFLGFYLVGLAYGASAPVLLDITSQLPGFELALNYRLVFLSSLGLAGLAALGMERIEKERSSRALAVAAAAILCLLALAFFLARGVFRERDLPEEFLRVSFAYEILPLLFLLAAAILFRSQRHTLAGAAFLLLVVERGLEMHRTYPTLRASTLAPELPTLASLPRGGEPYRIVAAGEVFRPNGAALYGLQDVRGYESLLLDDFVKTYPLWCRPQFASFNRVEDLNRPFLSFLNVRFAIASREEPVPPGWEPFARGREMAIFENPRALARAFVPRRLRIEPNAEKRLAEMANSSDFSEVAWLSAGPPGLQENSRDEVENGSAELSLKESGTDLLVSSVASSRVFVATSLPSWPGWVAQSGRQKLLLVRVNHAFLGFWLPPGRTAVRLRYSPSSFRQGVLAFFAAVVVVAAGSLFYRRSRR